MSTRREKVELDLVDRFTGPMMKAAGATALLKKELNSLSGTAIKGAGNDLDAAGKKADKAAESIDKVGKSSDNSAKQIDRLSGRMRLLGEAAFVLGPALLPIGAAAVPAVMGLAAGFGAAAAAAGIAVMAFQGVGDAIEALDAYQLEPTAANLEDLNTAMDALGPSGQQFVQTIDAMEPALKQLQESAREGLFPGVEEGLSSLMSMLPQVEQIVSNIATEMGNLAAEAGKGLAGPGFADFFRYIETDAAPTLEAFGHTIGSVAEGFGHLVVAFAPLTRDFSSGMENMAASFAKWADGLSQTNGFHDFVGYIQQSGPQVIALIGALADAIVGIATAAAPLGHVVLPALTGILQVFAAIANSPIGPVLYTAAAGMIALSRATTLATAGMARFGASAAVVGRATTGLRALGGAAVGILAVSAAIRQINESSRDAMPGVEQMTQQLTELANSGNAAVLSQQFQDLSDDLSRVFNKSTSDSIGDFFYKWSGGQAILGDTQNTQEATDEINALDQALANIVNTQGPEAAARALQSLADSGAITSSQLNALRKNLPQYDEALAGVANRADNAAGATHGFASALSAADKKIHVARQSALTTAQSFMRFGDSLGNAKVSLGQWLTELRKQASALQNFTQNARTAARRGLDEGLIKSLQEAGPVGAMRMRQLANATDSELARANRSWRAGQQAIKEYVNVVGGVPTAKATTLSVHDLATMKVQAIRSQLASIDRHIDIYIQAHASQLPNNLGHGPQVTSADGGTVPRTGLPYADRHPYLLADGEEVISNRYGQADRYRSLLKAINANQRLAGGGTAGGSSRMFVASDGVDALNRTASQLAATQKKQNDAEKSHLEHMKHALDTRKKLLEKELERDQHEVDRDKKRHDAMVQELQDLKQQRQQLMAQTKSQFRTDIFGSGGVDLAAAIKNGTIPSEILQKITGTGTNGAITDQDVQDYLATLSPQQLQALQAQAGIRTLGQDAQNADAFQKAIQRAKRHGLSGGLLHYLEASGNLGAAQQFARMSDGQIDAYEKAYKNRNYELNQTAQMVGNDKYGAAINAQTKVAQRTERILERSEERYKETNHALHRLEHRTGQLEKAIQHVGKDTAHALDHTAANSQRRKP